MPVADGFRAGGFNVFSPAADHAPTSPKPRAPTELGARAGWPGNRLCYSGAAS